MSRMRVEGSAVWVRQLLGRLWDLALALVGLAGADHTLNTSRAMPRR
jgi:hypothetical protein